MYKNLLFPYSPPISQSPLVEEEKCQVARARELIRQNTAPSNFCIKLSLISKKKIELQTQPFLSQESFARKHLAEFAFNRSSFLVF
jgi:hypothetical protein